MQAGVGTTEDSAPIQGDYGVSAGVGVLNIIAGLMLVAAFLFFFGGLIAYLTRLGLEGRVQGLGYMHWGVTILFVLIIVLGIVRFVQFHPEVVYFLAAIVIVVFVAWAVVKSAQGATSAKTAEEE